MSIDNEPVHSARGMLESTKCVGCVVSKIGDLATRSAHEVCVPVVDQVVERG